MVAFENLDQIPAICRPITKRADAIRFRNRCRIVVRTQCSICVREHSRVVDIAGENNRHLRRPPPWSRNSQSGTEPRREALSDR